MTLSLSRNRTLKLFSNKTFFKPVLAFNSHGRFRRALFACIFCAGFFVFGFGGRASAATYYMRADGTVTAINKANATGCGAVGTALNVSNHNSATFLAGDTIYLCDTGGSYTTALIPPTSGSNGSPITYTNAPGSSPIIAVSGNSLSFYVN